MVVAFEHGSWTTHNTFPIKLNDRDVALAGFIQILFEKDVVAIPGFDRTRIGPETIFRRRQVFEAIERVVCVAGPGPEPVSESPLFRVQRALEMAGYVLRSETRESRDHFRIRRHAKQPVGVRSIKLVVRRAKLRAAGEIL